jgi:prophage antirepressor-like protein
MPRFEILDYEGRPVRLVLMNDRWWIFADDAAQLVCADASAEELFEDAAEDERQTTNLMNPKHAHLVSARQIMHLLREGDSPKQHRLRAWLRAWRIVTGSEDPR